MKAKTQSVMVSVNGAKVLLPKDMILVASDYQKKARDIARREKLAKKLYG